MRARVCLPPPPPPDPGGDRRMGSSRSVYAARGACALRARAAVAGWMQAVALRSTTSAAL